MIEITRPEDLPALVVALRSRVAELERSLNHHREEFDLRVAELRLWLKRHGVTEPALTEFWNIVANKRPQGSISDPDDPNDLGLNLAQRNERLSAALAKAEAELHERDDYRKALQEIADSNYCDYGDTAHQDIARAVIARAEGRSNG